MLKNSKNQLPGIAFEKGEHLVLVIKPTKLIPIGFWAGAFLASAFLIAASILINGGGNLFFNLDPTSRSFFMMIILIVLGTIWIATLVSTHVYSGNRLYVTNKRLIQNIVTSLFSSSTNVIDLVAVEDVSFKKSGIFEHLFSIGTLRMSTIGSETTYTFKNVDTPTDELETITHLVHLEKGDISDATCATNSHPLKQGITARQANMNPQSFQTSQDIQDFQNSQNSQASQAPQGVQDPQNTPSSQVMQDQQNSQGIQNPQTSQVPQSSQDIQGSQNSQNLQNSQSSENTVDTSSSTFNTPF